MHGTVRAHDGTPMAGVVVTNGRDSVRTDHDGRYELPDEGAFVTVSRPAGLTADPWWHRTADGPADFVLTPVEQTLPFEFIHLTDTHLSDPEAAATPRRAAALYPEGSSRRQFSSLLEALPTVTPGAQAVFLTGDLVDEGTAVEYETLVEILEGSPRPVYAIAGNHDHMNGGAGSTVSPNGYLTNQGDPTLYEHYLGPRWYSFDVPGLHVVAMDWHTHELGLDDSEQEDWLRGDLALVPDSTPWILLFHDQPGATVLAAAPRPPLATFSGHWHTSRVVRIGETLHVNTPPSFFAGLDYSPPMLRRVTWDGERISLDTRALDPHTGVPATNLRAKFTIAATTRSPRPAPILWTTTLTGAALRQGATISGRDVVVGSQIEDAPAGCVDCLDLGTGEIRWSVPTDAAIKATPAVARDLVVVADVTGAVHAYDRRDGHHVWTRPSSDPFRRFAWGAPVVAGDLVLVGDQADLRCLDLATGELRWRRTDIAPHHNLVNHSAPLVVDDLVVVGFWPSPQYPIGLDLHTGQDRWTTPDAGPTDTRNVKRLLVMGTATHDAVSGSAILPAHGLTLSVDLDTGRRLWAAPHEGGFSPSAPVVTELGVVVTVGGVGLRMLDKANGRTLWDAPVDASAAFPFQPYTKSGHAVLAPPTALDDHLALPCLDGGIRAYSNDGRLTRCTPLGVPVAAPLAYGGDVLVGIDVDGCVFALDTKELL